MTRSGDLDLKLHEAFGDRVQRHAPLAPLTTFKVGGAAEWLLTLHGVDELRFALRLANECGAPVRVLGGGSNVLVSDRGVPGLVIRLRGAGVTSLDPSRVRADAALTINGLVRWTINRGVAGLEAWAGTPGTVGGAIFGNAHFQGRNIGELVDRVLLIDRNAALAEVPASEMEFGYDFSRIQRSGEVVVSADFHVERPAIPPSSGRPRASRSPFENAPSHSSQRAQAASFRIRIPRATAYLTGFRRRREPWWIARA